MIATLWAFITFLVKYGPQIWSAIASGVDEITMTFKLRAFDKAATTAETTGDQRDLEDLFDPGRHKRP